MEDSNRITTPQDPVLDKHPVGQLFWFDFNSVAQLDRLRFDRIVVDCGGKPPSVPGDVREPDVFFVTFSRKRFLDGETR